jgi:nitroreductase
VTDPAEIVRPLLRVRQIREFTDQPVPRDILDALADAARWSGSATNSQPWRFVIITSKETLRAIGAAGLPSTGSLRTATAAIAIVLPRAKGMGTTNAFDEGRAAERVLVCASLLKIGAGIAWINDEARPRVAELLRLPEDRFVRTVVAVGYPTPNARRPKAAKGEARLPREETVFHEAWGGAEDS